MIKLVLKHKERTTGLQPVLGPTVGHFGPVQQHNGYWQTDGHVQVFICASTKFNILQTTKSNGHWRTHTHISTVKWRHFISTLLKLKSSKVNSKKRVRVDPSHCGWTLRPPTVFRQVLPSTPSTSQGTTLLKQCSTVNHKYNVLLLVVILYFYFNTCENRMILVIYTLESFHPKTPSAA